MTIDKCLITLNPLANNKEHQPGYTLRGVKYMTGSAHVTLQLPFTRQEFITEKPRSEERRVGKEC